MTLFESIFKKFKDILSPAQNLSGSLWDIDLALQGDHNLRNYNHQVKAVLLVNTATACGLHNQLFEIEELYQQYSSSGLLVIAIPSDNFLSQEPLNDDQLPGYCSLHYGLTVPMALKVDVKGDHQHPLYQWLSRYRAPLWNYHKYLFNAQGALIQDFYPTTSVKSSQVVEAIEKTLQAQKLK